MAVTPAGGQFGVVKLAAVSDTLSGTIYCNFLYWVSKAASAGDDLLVKDSDGNILWEDSADGANYSAYCPLKMKIDGINAYTLDSGSLYVYKAGSDREHSF
jgi:hypothetical protein